MAELNFSQIYEGIAAALDAEFPESLVFRGDVPQGQFEGNFSVAFVDATAPERVRKRVKRIVCFDVIYYPHEANLQSDILRVSALLRSVLDTIATPNGSIVHALSDMQLGEVDKVLHCTVRYPFFVRETIMEPAKDGEPGEETDTGLWPNGGAVTGLSPKDDPDDPDDDGIDLMYILEHPEREA